MTAKVARLSYFFPAHNEEANLAGLVAEALETLPGLADTFEIVIVDDGSKDATGRIADELTAANPGVVRAVHHPTNLGYGAALRSGFQAAQFEHVAFTDGDRQFQVVDIGRLIDRLGFEVSNLEAFCQRARGLGITFDAPCARDASGIVRARLTDPWGTSIELTQGLRRY